LLSLAKNGPRSIMIALLAHEKHGAAVKAEAEKRDALSKR